MPAFRQSLLTHASHTAAPVRSGKTSAPCSSHRPAAPETETVDLAAGIEVQFRWDSVQASRRIPLAKAAFLALRARWPEAMSFDELLTAVTRFGYGEIKADDALHWSRFWSQRSVCACRADSRPCEPSPSRRRIQGERKSPPGSRIVRRADLPCARRIRLDGSLH